MAEKLAEVELDSIQMTVTKHREFGYRHSHSDISREDDIETQFGVVHVVVQGQQRSASTPAILTFHDIGLTSASCFEGFFSYADMQPILKYFVVYHVNAPGQCEGAQPLGNSLTLKQLGAVEYQYPTMDQLAETLLPVLRFYGLHRFIGFGAGAGANVLARFALNHPEHVESLCLLNCSSTQASWTEWGYQKWNAWYLNSGMKTPTLEEYLLWHWLGKETTEKNHDLVQSCLAYIKGINAQNLGHFITSYIKRTDLGIVREVDPQKKLTVRTIRCPTMLVTGDYSPHLDDTVAMNARLDPAVCSWMKFECGAMIQEEAPAKLCEAFRLFLQGQGYVPHLNQVKLAGRVPREGVVWATGEPRRKSQTTAETKDDEAALLTSTANC